MDYYSTTYFKWEKLVSRNWNKPGGPARGAFQVGQAHQTRDVKLIKTVAEVNALQYCSKIIMTERWDVKGPEQAYLCSAGTSDGKVKFQVHVPLWNHGTRVTEEDMVQVLVNVEAAITAATRPGHFRDRHRGTKRRKPPSTLLGVARMAGNGQQGPPAKRRQQA